jgi:hypothetical protein
MTIFQVRYAYKQTTIADEELGEARKNRVETSESLKQAQEAKDATNKLSEEIGKYASDSRQLYNDLLRKNELASEIIKKLETDFYRVKDIKVYMTFYFLENNDPEKFYYVLSSHAISFIGRNCNTLLNVFGQFPTEIFRKAILVDGTVTPDDFKDPKAIKYELPNILENKILMIDNLKKINHLNLSIFKMGSQNLNEIIPLIDKIVIDVAINGLTMGNHTIENNELNQRGKIENSKGSSTYRIDYNVNNSYITPREKYSNLFEGITK